MDDNTRYEKRQVLEFACYIAKHSMFNTVYRVSRNDVQISASDFKELFPDEAGILYNDLIFYEHILDGVYVVACEKA